MRKRFLVFLFTLLITFPSFTQYANMGTGSLRNEIWWFDWANINFANGSSRVFFTPDGLTVTVTLANVSAAKPVPSVMNTWNGAVLHLLYNFTDPAIKPAIFHNNSTGVCSFTLNITATRDGVPVPFSMIAADAEGSADGEFTSLTTDGSNWQSITLFRNSGQTNNPLTGCNTQTVKITDTYGGASQYGQNPIVTTRSVSGSMKLDVLMDHALTTGGMATAFGIMAPADRGDLPAVYGVPLHLLSYTISNPCNHLAPLPAVNPAQSLYIGTAPADADAYAINDDNATGMDEDGVTAFPAYVYGSGTYTVQVGVTNHTGQDAYLGGWFDFNRNELFETGEFVLTTVPNNASSVTVTWNGLPTYLPQGFTNGYPFRFRLSSSLAAVQRPVGNAPDGEVEDYLPASQLLCSPLTVRTRADTLICAGQPVRLQTTGGVGYIWIKGAPLDTTEIANPIANPSITTEYIVTGFNPQGCFANDTVVVAVSPAPVISITGNQLICPNASVPLSANAAGAVTFSWTPQTGLSNPNISNPIATPTTTTTYEVTASNSIACASRKSVTVQIRPAPVFAVQPANPIVCEGDNISVKASGGDTYLWQAFDNTTLSNNDQFSFQATDSRVVKVTITENACLRDSTIEVPITVNRPPDLTVTKSNDISCSNGQATLQVTGGVSYEWDAVGGLRNNQSANAVVRPLQTTTYFVTGKGSNGCFGRDSIAVNVDVGVAVGTFPVPSAFTPNGDGRNDCFGLKQFSAVTSLQFDVFNRWGQRVFTTTDAGACWDGNFKGIPQPEGGYIYQIKATTLCGNAYRRGMVMLIR